MERITCQQSKAEYRVYPHIINRLSSSGCYLPFGQTYRILLKKTAEGKNKMSVLNMVRNKIIHRTFAVIKNQKFYKNKLI